MIKGILFFLILCSTIKGADCTLALGANNPKNLSATGGLWTGTGCTGGSFIPGSVDTIVDVTGTGSSRLTFDQNLTIGNAQTTNVNAMTFSIPITILGNVTISIQGKLTQTATTGNITFDATNGPIVFQFQPPNGSAVVYTWVASGYTTNATGHFMSVQNTTSTNTVTIKTDKSLGGTSSAQIALGDTYYNSGQLWGATYASPAQYVYFTDIGKITAYFNYANSSWRCQYCVFTRVGPADIYAHTQSNVQCDDCIFTESTSSYNFSPITATAATAGTRSIQRSVFDKDLGGSGATTGHTNHLVLADLWVGGNIVLSTAGGTWTSADRIFVRKKDAATQSPIIWAGVINKLTGVNDTDAGNQNCLGLTTGSGATPSVTDAYFEFAGKWAVDNGDCLVSPTSNPISAMVVGISRVVVASGGNTPVAGVQGDSGNFMTMVCAPSSTCTNVSYTIEHSINYTNHGLGGIDLENYIMPANKLTLRSNWFGSPVGTATARKGYKLLVTNTAARTDNPCVDAASCNYNAGWNVTATNAFAFTNQGKSYAADFSVSPIPGNGAGNIGQYDLDDVDFMFAAVPALANSNTLGRSIVTFDQQYLGIPLSGTSWSAGGSYTFDQIVKNQVSTLYANNWINYRCIAAAGCLGSTPNSEPGNGSAWRTYWEYAAYKAMRASLDFRTRQLYTDGAIGASGVYLHELFRLWVMAAWTPQNPIVWCTGHDGESIGAVPFCAKGKAMIGALLRF